jgi:hypothetical protein
MSWAYECSSATDELPAGRIAQRIPLDNLREQRLFRFLDYWRSKSAQGRLPLRRDIDPSEFRWALGLVCLLDVEQRPLRFRYRLDGSVIATRNGHDMTGRAIDAIEHKPSAGMLHGQFATVVAEKAPAAHRICTEHGIFGTTYERLALPLSHDGHDVSMIMTVAANMEIEQSQHVRCFFR